MGSTDTLAYHVARQLRSVGLNAVSWDSGGGTVGVGIAQRNNQTDERHFFFGTADEAWPDEDGEVEDGITTPVESLIVDVPLVVAGIVRPLADFAAKRA